MAKRKKNSAPKNTAPQKAPVQEKENPNSRVINELFGSLEQEPDIENDIAELGTGADSSQAEPEKPHRNRFFFGFGVVVIVLALIGVFSSVRFVAQIASNLVDNTSLKNEFAQFIFPVVVNDIAPFEEVDEIPDSSKISCSIWNILVNMDTTDFENQEGGLTIPEYNVSASCRELFGSSVSLEHQTVGTAEVRFTYDPDTHTYSATKNIRYLTYSPQIVSLTNDGDVYTLIVGYLPPTVASVAGVSGIQAVPEKYMEYTISRWEGRDTLMSVRFSDYQPQTEEVNPGELS